MRLIKSLLVAAVVATASLATAATAQADVLSHFSFVGRAKADTFFTTGNNVRVGYRCTTRTRKGLIQVTSSEDGSFARRARARCDGARHSVLLRTRPVENTVLLQQDTAAFAEVLVIGRPCDTAACFG
jgi:hypothetical protein